MSNEDQILNLPNIIKNARKYSLIGEYGNSLEKYQEAISIINQRQSELSNENEDMKSKWKMTECNIKSEMLQIKQILETCIQLHHSKFNYTKSQSENIPQEKAKIENKITEIFSKEEPTNRVNIANKNNKTININSNSNKKSKSEKNTPFKEQKHNFANKYSQIINKQNNSSSKRENKKINSSKKNVYEKKMFNPIEEFHMFADSKKKKREINGKEFGINKFHSDEKNDKINNGSNKIKRIKVVEINLEDKNNDILDKNENNIDIEEELKNIPEFKFDNDDDLF